MATEKIMDLPVFSKYFPLFFENMKKKRHPLPPPTTSSRTYTQGGHDATFHTHNNPTQSLSLSLSLEFTAQQQPSNNSRHFNTHKRLHRDFSIFTSFPSFQVLGSLK
jgi:hypothetical protein